MKNIEYRQKSYLKNSLFIAIIVINLFLLVAVVNLMTYTQKLLNDDIRLNLTEIATQNKDVITSKLKLEINNLNMTAENLAREYKNQDFFDANKMKTIFLNYADEEKDPMLFLALENGEAVFPNGEIRDISGRAYYRLAMEGTQNISDRIVSRLDGEDIFVISIPFYYKGEIVGTVQKIYTLDEMYKICSVSLFSEQGHMYIINNQGYILLSSQPGEYSRESDNYFRMIYSNNQNQAKTLEENIKAEKAGFMEVILDGEKNFSVYTPIEEVYDWYLISSIPVSTVSPNSSIVIKMFYCVLFGVILIFAVSLFYFLHFKNKQQHNLEKLAFKDNVTDGNTYTRFMVEIDEILESNPQGEFYIMSFDIDNFKYFNNFYGFEFGDSVLKTVYQRFSRLLEKNETIARVYSDNFVILLKDVTPERLKMLSNMELKQDGINVFISGGIYKINDKSESKRLMMDKARIAAKSVKGVRFKDIALYSEEFDNKMINDENTKRAVEKALAEDEITPYYQPKVDINTCKVVGAEALARWITKEGKIVAPMEFIPVCERSGLIGMVDMVIFEKTLRFLKKQLDEGVNCVPISVNFSRLHLENPNFLDELVILTNKYKVPNNLIEIELTETVIFENHDIIEELIEKAHLIGMSISMDDFGTGYSSLHMLKDIPIDILKIDGSFLKGIDTNGKNKIIFSAITKMVNDLNIDVVVEGVETEANVNLMKELGSIVAQGYYYSRPLRELDFEKIYVQGEIK